MRTGPGLGLGAASSSKKRGLACGRFMLVVARYFGGDMPED
jgi:hypothetical protein